MNSDEIIPIAQRGHGRGVDKRRKVPPQQGIWKTRLPKDDVERLQALRDRLDERK